MTYPDDRTTVRTYISAGSTPRVDTFPFGASPRDHVLVTWGELGIEWPSASVAVRQLLAVVAELTADMTSAELDEVRHAADAISASAYRATLELADA